MFFRPSGTFYFAPNICQIPEMDNIPDDISSIFNGLELWIFGKHVRLFGILECLIACRIFATTPWLMQFAEEVKSAW